MTVSDLIALFHSSTFVGFLAAVFGGIGVRFLDKALSRRSEKFSEDAAIRKELREDINTLTSQNEKLEDEAKSWRLRYWEIFEYYARLRTRAIQLDETLENKFPSLTDDDLGN